MWTQPHRGEKCNQCMCELAWAVRPGVAPRSSSRRAGQRQATGHGVGIFNTCTRNTPERDARGLSKDTMEVTLKRVKRAESMRCELTVADVHLRLTGEEAVFSSSHFTAVQCRSHRNCQQRRSAGFWMFEIITNSQINTLRDAGRNHAIRETRKLDREGF